jgi:hypothetical protein
MNGRIDKENKVCSLPMTLERTGLIVSRCGRANSIELHDDSTYVHLYLLYLHTYIMYVPNYHTRGRQT